jgi:hypothetical protein
MIWRVVLIGFCLTGTAHAQDDTAFRIGFRIAQARGYDNADCYARVFARHAVLVERPDGRRGWRAASTPAYNAEQRSRCGIDRLQDVATRSPARMDAVGSIPYRIGLSLAAHRHIWGASAKCFARTFETYAVRRPAPGQQVTYGLPGASEHVFGQELRRSCGLTY